MVFADWTFSGSDSGALDGDIKYAGTSSYRAHLYPGYGVAEQNYLTHDTFNEPQAQIILWTRYYRDNALSGAAVKTYIKHNSYADVQCIMAAYNTWEKHRVTFWYDATTNTKWGRDERWTGGAWVATGSDVNCGAGSPSPGSIVLHSWGYISSGYLTARSWFDELEVSA